MSSLSRARPFAESCVKICAEGADAGPQRRCLCPRPCDVVDCHDVSRIIRFSRVTYDKESRDGIGVFRTEIISRASSSSSELLL